MPTLLAAGKYIPLPVTLVPVGISFAAVAVPVVAKFVPSKVKPAESVSRPPVVEYTTRPDVRPVLVIDVEAVKVVNAPAAGVVAPTVPFITAPVSVLLVKVSVVAFPTKVSVAAGSVSTVVPATAVAATVVVPDVEPANLTVPARVNVLPVPMLRPTLVPVPAASNTESTNPKSAFIFVPQVSVEAPTSGLVSSKLVVVESAMICS